MNRPLVILLAGAALASCSSTGRINYLRPQERESGITAIKDSSLAKRLNLAEYEKKYGEYQGVFLNSEQVYEHSGGSGDWNFNRIRKLRYLVLKPDADWLTTFHVEEEAGNKLEDIYIHVYNPDGTARAFGIDDLKVETSSDRSKVYKFAYPDVKKGTIIEEAYDMRQFTYPISRSTNHDIALQFSVPCERVSVEYAYPEWWRVQLKEVAPGKSIPYRLIRDPENHKTTLFYEEKNVPPLEEEVYSPYRKELGRYLEFMVTELSMGSGLSYTTPADWTEFSTEFKSYFVDKESFWSGKVGSTVDDVIREKKNDLEKLDTIVGHVQRNVKVGSTLVSDNFADVLKRGEGNWYMITGLTRAMLEKAGIASDFLLIHSALDGALDSNYISPDQFYLPAVGTTIDGRFYVVFPWIRNLPITHIPEYFQGQTALKINKEGYNGFVQVPYGILADNTIQENYDLTIDDDGNISVKEEKMLLGDNAFSVRESLNDMKPEEVDKLMKEMLTYSDGDIRLTSHEIVNREDYGKPLIIRLNYTIDNLVTVTPEEVIFQTGGLFSPSSSRKTKVETEERKNPIRIYADERIVKNITIRHPASWKLSGGPENVAYENRFGSIKATYRASAGEFHAEQERLLKRASESKEKITDLMAVTGRKSRLHIPTLVFEIH